MTESRRYRLGIVASHVIQYQDPLFQLLARHPQIDLTVLYCSRHGADRYFDRDMGAEVQWDIEPLSGYRFEFLRNVSPFGPHRPWLSLINPGVLRAIRKNHFDAVLLILGWGTITAWLAFFACRSTGTPVMIYGDSSFPPPDTGVRGRLRRRIMQWFFARTNAFLVSGRFNRDYYLHYGGEPSRFFEMPWATDNDRFARVSAITTDERSALRARYGLATDRVVVVFSGKLVPRKDPLLIIEAIARMKHRSRAAALFIGDGELKAQILEAARRHGLDQVAITGFINQRELPRIYAIGDVFVLPSTFEPRGMVVNEAMACGLPAVVSASVGSSGDIVGHGDNGFVFPTGDATALASVLDQLVDDSGLRRRMGQRSREIISTWDYRADVQGILGALQFVRAK